MPRHRFDYLDRNELYNNPDEIRLFDDWLIKVYDAAEYLGLGTNKRFYWVYLESDLKLYTRCIDLWRWKEQFWYTIRGEAIWFSRSLFLDRLTCVVEYKKQICVLINNVLPMPIADEIIAELYTEIKI